jgi:putative SOS response-associated peptidase YedK
VQVQKIEVIEDRFNVKVPEHLEIPPRFNISPGDYAPVITSDKPREVQMFQFGLTPFWAKKPMYLFNARAEGDRNKENDPAYKGARDIISKPAFRKPIRSKRCLIIADAFIEGPAKERLSKPYLVYLRDKQAPFAFAGIWDTWQNKENGEDLHSFSIITTTANKLIQKIGHHRCPVILPRGLEASWLNPDSPLTDITRALQPYPGDKMNAYPISPAIKNPRAEGRQLIEPTGGRLAPEQGYSLKKDLELLGMGRYKGRNKLE